MKQRASINSVMSFVFRSRCWLGLVMMLGLFSLAQVHANYVPDENYNPVWAGAETEPAEGPDWNDDEGDSVPNWLEAYFETAAWLADTDSDGLSDYDEIFGTGTNPLLWDTDGNGFSDADNLIQPPDAGDVPPPQPTADDIDGDGLPYLWELAYALNDYDPTDAGADPDGDSLTNLEEYQHSTDPYAWNDATTVTGSVTEDEGSSTLEANTDADQDGLPDSWELTHGLNPNDAGDIADDPDGDFILNIEEYQHGSDPQVAEDFWAVMGYPIDTASLIRHDDGTERDADWDGDGVNNLIEILIETDPRTVMEQTSWSNDPYTESDSNLDDGNNSNDNTASGDAELENDVFTWGDALGWASGIIGLVGTIVGSPVLGAIGSALFVIWALNEFLEWVTEEPGWNDGEFPNYPPQPPT